MHRQRFLSGVMVMIAVCSTGYANPLGLSMSRLHEDYYEPGTAVTITVVVAGIPDAGIDALGLYEILPEGWRYGGVMGQDGNPPAVYPPTGAGPQLEFAWIALPGAAFSFSYTALAPEYARDGVEIRGTLEYRTREGRYFLPEIVTMLQGPEAEAPTIVLRGETVMEVAQHGTWEEPGYVALGAGQRDLSRDVIVSGEVRTETPGLYRLRYTLLSESGDILAEAERSVQVVEATAAAETSAGETSTGEENALPGGRLLPHRFGAAPGEMVKPPSPENQPVRGEDTEEPNNRAFVFPDLSAFRPVLPESNASDGAEAEGERAAPGQQNGQMAEVGQGADLARLGGEGGDATGAVAEVSQRSTVEHAGLHNEQMATHEESSPNRNHSRLYRWVIAALALLVAAGIGVSAFLSGGKGRRPGGGEWKK